MGHGKRLQGFLLALLLVLVACGGPSGETGDGEAGQPGEGDDLEGTIEVWIMDPGSEALASFLDQAVADFEAENEGTSVELQLVPWPQAHDQFVTAVGGGQTPDLAEMGTTWTPEFAALGGLASLGESLGEGYVEAVVNSATLDGQIFGLPWYAGARALIYRADVLEEVGVEVPATWDELVQVGRSIQEQTDLHAFGVDGTSNHYFLPMIWQNGGEIAAQTDDGWESRIDSPEAVEAIQFYADLYAEEGFAPEGALTWNSRDVRSAFAAGDLAMMFGGGWDYRGILSEAPDLEGAIGTALVPEGPAGSRQAFAGGSHLVIFEGSEEKDLARAFAEFLLEPDRVREFADQLGFLPGTIDGIEATGYQEDELLAPFAEQLADHARTYPPVPEWGGFEGEAIFANAVQQIMQGAKTAEEAMAEVAETMNQAFQE